MRAPPAPADKKAAKKAQGLRRGGHERAAAKRRSQDEVSLEDRLGSPGTTASGPRTVLPGDPKATTVQPQSRRQLRRQREAAEAAGAPPVDRDRAGGARGRGARRRCWSFWRRR